ncbi:MAG TPA: sensor histidine kinase [Thermoanaerobaculia bacterium]|jgi:two-component system sensor histidine kinase DesK
MRLIPHDDNLGWTPYAWLIYIVPFTVTPLLHARQNTPAHWLLYGAATLVFTALYFRGYWKMATRERLLIAGALMAMGIGFWPISYGAGTLFIYAAGALGAMVPARRAAVAVGVVALVVILEGWFLQRSWINIAWPVLFTLIIGAINIHFSQVSRANARLRLAHDEIEHLAKVAERERIARDLHDLLGHTLSLIVLKSELATKLTERDPERARNEIRDVERIARDALAEVRSAVLGYRRGGFNDEVAHARKTLATAGIETTCEVAKAQLPPAHEAVLSLTLREAITNIVRHSGARHVRIALTVDDSCHLTISDDGRGGNTPFGNGLTGMRERLEILGGAMTRDGRRGTTLEVTLPMTRIQERSA